MSNNPVTTEIREPGSVPDSKLKYVVMAASYRDEWIFVRLRDRNTWEMPAGHIEPGESPEQAAMRELFEEAAVVRSSLNHLCDYAVTAGGRTEYGRLYRADVLELEETLEFETVEILLTRQLPASLTYPEVQTCLFSVANR